MTITIWTLLSVLVVCAVTTTAIGRPGNRRRVDLVVAVLGVGALLLLLGADMLALSWLLALTPSLWNATEPRADDLPAPRTRLAGGVLAAGLLAACYMLTQRLDWHGLPADEARPQASELAFRLADQDAVVPLVLGISILMVLMWRGRLGAS